MASDIPALVAMAFRVVMDHVHERLADDGFGDLRPAHGFAFEFLSTHDGATAADLGKHLDISKQAAALLVDELQARGYVERVPHPSDGRSRVLTLTPRGRACIERVVDLWAETERHWVELIGAERVASVRHALRMVTDAAGDQPAALRPVW